MANDYYNSSGVPGTGSFAASSPIRGQYGGVEDGFDKLPSLTGNGRRAVVVNPGGTALTVTVGSLALSGDWLVTGDFDTSIVTVADITLTLPGVSGTLIVQGGPLGTPSSGVATNLTGTASGLTVGFATTATNATNATNATTALTASFATSAGSATTASSATTATTAAGVTTTPAGGTVQFVGPSGTRLFTLPDAATTIITTGSSVTVTVGYKFTPNNLGNITSFTVDPALGNYQYGTNHGAATITAPASDCSIVILVTNDGSAGTLTFSGFTVGSTGDPLTTVNGSKFVISILRINSVSTYVIKALQA